MSLNLSFNNDELIEIDGSHRVFDETSFEGGDFLIQIKPMTRTEAFRIEKKHTTQRKGRATLDEFGYQRELFRKLVVDWSGLNANGKPLECSDENKDQVFNHYGQLANGVINAANDAKGIEATRSEDEKGNS